MNPLTISFNAQTAEPAIPSVKLDPYLVAALGNTNHLIPGITTDQPKDASIQFSSVLAHEIRNPLTNINLSVTMLESVIKDNDLKIYLDIIMRSSVRINSLINELLKYQLANEAPAEKYSIHQLLDEVLEMAKDRIMLKNIMIRKDYDLQDCKIILNRSKMIIALTNIIINAIDAMPLEKGKLKLVTKSMGSRFAVEIGDNGCGIKKENLKNIFKPYFTNKPGGLGLGLATTYEILQSNHIMVKVESGEENGEGTRFVLFFRKKYQHSLFK